MTLRIAGWDDHFENNRTREVKTMHWVPVPTKQDGDGYTDLLDHPAGAAHLGAWVAILQVAAKCEQRGTLVRSRGGSDVAHDAKSLSRVTRIALDVMEEAIGRLLEIGWIERVTTDAAEGCENVAEGCEMPAAVAHKSAPTLQNNTVQDNIVCVGKGERHEHIEGWGDVALPDEWDTPEVRDRLATWAKHVRTIRGRFSPDGHHAALKNLAGSKTAPTAADLLAVLDDCMARECFQLKDGRNQSRGSPKVKAAKGKYNAEPVDGRAF